MKLGYSSNAFVKFSIFAAVEKIAQLASAGIEIMCDRPHLYPGNFNHEGVACLKQSIEDRGLKITNLNSFTLFQQTVRGGEPSSNTEEYIKTCNYAVGPSRVLSTI